MKNSSFNFDEENGKICFQKEFSLAQKIHGRLQKRESLKSISIAVFEKLDNVFECEGDIEPNCGKNPNAEYSSNTGQALCEQSGATFIPCTTQRNFCNKNFACAKSLFDCGKFGCDANPYVCQTVDAFRCSGQLFNCHSYGNFQCLSFNQYECTNIFNCGGTPYRKFDCSAGQGAGTVGSFGCGFTPSEENKPDSADNFSCNANATSFSCTTSEFKCEKSTLFRCDITNATLRR